MFDISTIEAVERLHAARASFQDRGDLEALDEHHFILIIRPGVPKAAA